MEVVASKASQVAVLDALLQPNPGLKIQNRVVYAGFEVDTFFWVVC